LWSSFWADAPQEFLVPNERLLHINCLELLAGGFALKSSDCTTAKICELGTGYSGRGNGCLYTGLAPIHWECILSIAIISPLIRKGYIPDLLKSSMIFPIPKVTPPQSIESELRPISLTCNLAKIIEGIRDFYHS
jgi:hypothetical protein